MMSVAVRALSVVVLMLLLCDTGRAMTPGHDSRRLTPREEATFLPLVCLRHYRSAGKSHCVREIGATAPAQYDDVFGLTSILYGSFTHAGAREAYLSYSSDAEAHVTNFGGGVLFERRGARWRLVKWYPGGQMDNCLALPGTGREQLLCLTYYGGMGRLTQHVLVRHVPPNPSDRAVLNAQDDRGLDLRIACARAEPAKGEALLLDIGIFGRSEDPAFFAKAAIAYATPAAVNDACASGHFNRVRTTAGVVRFHARGANVTPVTPVRFGEAAY